LLFDVKRTKYINWILGLRQTTFVALFYYQVYKTTFKESVSLFCKSLEKLVHL
jgi:hypothetical protein